MIKKIDKPTDSEYFRSGDGAIVDWRKETEFGEFERRQTGRDLIGSGEWTEVVTHEDAVHDRSEHHHHRVPRYKSSSSSSTITTTSSHPSSHIMVLRPRGPLESLMRLQSGRS